MKLLRGFRYVVPALVVGAVALLPPPDHASPQTPSPAPTREAAAPAAPPFRLEELFQTAKESMQIPAPVKHREWAGGLVAAGQSQLAKREAGTLTPSEVEKLAAELVRRGRLEAAGPLIDAELRKQPSNTNLLLLGAIAHDASGATDLESRDLQRLQSSALTPEQKPLVDLLSRSLQMKQRGMTIGVDANPWNVTFPPPTPASAKLSAAEAAKLPSNTVEAIGRWLTLNPLQGNVWALLGQVLFVEERFSESKECFDRAKALRYTPTAVRQYLPALEQMEAARTKDALQQIAAPTGNSGSAAPAGGPTISVTESSLQVLAVVGLGGIVFGLLMGLQLSRRSARRK
jgi:hypothetical protein